MKKIERCPWAYGASPHYVPYHDKEWGVPVRDDRVQFEFLVLEGAQAGLSWSTILNKREGYRRAFAGFDPVKVARFTPRRIEAILKDPGIVRNRLKVLAMVNNARRFLEVQKEFGSFSKYIWGFVGGRQKVNRWKSLKQLPATSPESDALSADLKRRGFKFVGSTIVYAHMQATGLVNDHLVSCFRYKACLRAGFPARAAKI
jgi:DNA-3-methyladenine glycosylase I